LAYVSYALKIMAKNKPQPITAAELTAELWSDPEWVAKREQRDRARKEAREQILLEQAPLIDALAQAGVSVRDVWDLVNTSNPYPRAFPVLIEHLHRPYSGVIIEGIARALAVKQAREIAWDHFLKLAVVRPETWDSYTYDSVFVALSAMAKPSDLPVLISLISDRAIGPHRVFFVRNLMRSKQPEARETLLRLKDDPDLSKEISARLKV